MSQPPDALANAIENPDQDFAYDPDLAADPSESLSEEQGSDQEESEIEIYTEDVDAEESTYIEIPEAEVLPLESRFSRLYVAPARHGDQEPVPHKAEVIELPDSAVDDIHMLLTGVFFEQAGVDLAARAPEEILRFVAEAQRVKAELQERDAAVVDLNGILGTHLLHCVVLRETILMLQELRHASKEAPNGSARSFSHLPSDYYLVADAPRQRLLLAQTSKPERVFWQIPLGMLSECKAPRDALWMPGHSILCTDPQSRHVVERTLEGTIIWQFDSARTPDHALRSPVKATWYLDPDAQKRYLIVDQANHRVLEVNQNQEITWQYGNMGQSRDLEGYLNGPLDIQYTPQRSYLIADSGNHRVLEIKNNKIIHILSQVDGLERPVYAERLSNGNTLVVDEVRHGIFEYNAKSKRVHECLFFKPGMDERIKTGKGLKVLRRENQTLVLYDNDRILEVDYLNQKILAFYQLRTLQPLLSRPFELINAEDIEATQLNRGYETYDNGPPPAEIVTLRQMLMNVPLFESEKMPYFYEELEKILKHHDYHPDALIVEQGKPLRSMFFIQSGIVEIPGEKEGEPVVEMKAGESFGMMGIVFVEPRQSSIRAKTHCGLFELEKKPFDRLIERYPEIEAKITKLASERLVVSRIKKGQTEEKTKARFQEVLAMQKARFSSAHAKVNEPSSPSVPAVRATVQRPGFRPRRWEYNETEKHQIHEALSQGQQCLEVHIFLNRTSMMKGARAFLLIMVLEKLGQILRSEPSLDDIKGEKAVTSEIIITLATTHSRDQVIEDAASVSEVDKVEVITLGADDVTAAKSLPVAGAASPQADESPQV